MCQAAEKVFFFAVEKYSILEKAESIPRYGFFFVLLCDEEKIKMGHGICDSAKEVKSG